VIAVKARAGDMNVKISKRAVDAASEPGTFLWDAGDGAVKGFGLKVAAASKVYILQYRLGHHRNFPTRRYTIGKHGSPWTAETARGEARRLLAVVASGADPAAEKAAAKAEMTVADLCDLYVAEGCATKKPGSMAADRAEIERHIKPLVGGKKARTLARADVERLMRDIAAGKTACSIKSEKKRGKAVITGGQGMARKCVIRLSAVYNFSIARDIYTSNPAKGIKKYPERKLDRFLSAAELASLGEALAGAERAGKSPVGIAALRLLALSGCRKSEVLGLRWDHVDVENGCLRLPDSKTGRKAVPVGAAALALLASLPRLKGNPHVFPGHGGAHYGGIERVWRDVRADAGLNIRIHDLRHSFASVGAASGDSLIVIGAILGHSSAATTQRYAHLSNDPVRAAADRISGKIDAALGGKTGDVVKLSR
jgi:integrase